MNAHTSGPWHVNRSPVAINREILHVVAPHCHTRGSFVALVGRPNEGDCDDNARLISAAPDMLAALRRIYADNKDYDRFSSRGIAAEIAREAIAKADGKP